MRHFNTLLCFISFLILSHSAFATTTTSISISNQCHIHSAKKSYKVNVKCKGRHCTFKYILPKIQKGATVQVPTTADHDYVMWILGMTYQLRLSKNEINNNPSVSLKNWCYVQENRQHCFCRPFKQ